MAGAAILNRSVLLKKLQEEALHQGFAAASGVDLDAAWPIYREHVARYDDWLSRGYSGEMHYLVRGRDRRADPRLVFPETLSVFCVLEPYRKLPPGEVDPTKGVRYARYLDGPDYHERIAERLDTTLQAVAAANPELQLQWKTCVDTSAVLERTWAALSGLGWIGKNTLLIHPQLGSFTFIGIALLNCELGAAPNLLPDYCGNCERCLKKCPTGALKQARELDSRDCIAYWTLEKRGELALTTDQRLAMGNWVAGCDLCQEACPFNTKPVRHAELNPDLEPRFQQTPLTLSHWIELDAETDDDYRARVRGTALSRVKPGMFRRNLSLIRR